MSDLVQINVTSCFYRGLSGLTWMKWIKVFPIFISIFLSSSVFSKQKKAKFSIWLPIVIWSKLIDSDTSKPGLSSITVKLNCKLTTSKCYIWILQRIYKTIDIASVNFHSFRTEFWACPNTHTNGLCTSPLVYLHYVFPAWNKNNK